MSQKYRNPRKELETLETEEMERDQEIMNQPATTVEEETWKKRYGDLRRHADSIKSETENKVKELENKLEQALRGRINAPSSDEEVEQWMNEYPDFARILESIVQKRIKDATSATHQKLQSLEEKQKELAREEAVLKLKKVHPDLEQLTSSKEFHSWLSKQTQKYQDSIYKSLDVDEAAFVIDRYKDQKKSSNSKVEKEHNSYEEAARVVKPSSDFNAPVDDFDGNYEFSESQIEKMSRSNRTWYAQNEDKIMDAARRGKILYDVSGGAR